MSILDTWKEWDINKKIISIVAACFLVGIIIALVGLGNGGFGSSGIQMEITSDSSWSGTVVVGNTVTYVAGHGDKTFDLDGDSDDSICATINKDESYGDLTVIIRKDGKYKKDSASYPNGVVSIVWN